MGKDKKIDNQMEQLHQSLLKEQVDLQNELIEVDKELLQEGITMDAIAKLAEQKKQIEEDLIDIAQEITELLAVKEKIANIKSTDIIIDNKAVIKDESEKTDSSTGNGKAKPADLLKFVPIIKVKKDQPKPKSVKKKVVKKKAVVKKVIKKAEPVKQIISSDSPKPEVTKEKDS